MNQRIVILGFMACGKTTVAKELARRLECDFIDLDSVITESHGRSPAEIIRQDGEQSFRELETLALRDVLLTNSAVVIALGGGTWTTPENRTLIALHNCATVWLDAPFDVCWERIVTNFDVVRPLAPDRETARKRFNSRRGDYSLAEHRIAVTASDNQQTIANQILPLC